MKRFIIKFLICGLLVVAIDVCVGITHRRVFTSFPDKTSMVSTIYQSLFEKQADVLILGSSTANHHYNSKMMEDSLNMTVYNSGLDGRDMVYFDVVLQATLERCTPKYVLLDIGVPHLDGSWVNRISDTKLYYGSNNAVTRYYNTETDWQQKLKLISSLYRYNKAFSYLIRVYLDSPNDLNGFAPLKGHKEDIKPLKVSGFSLNDNELKHLDNIVSLCKKDGIILFFIQSPQAEDNTDFDEWMSNYALNKGVKLIQENKNSLYFNRTELFYDGSHLNSEGADVFTVNIIREISN